MNIIFYVTAGVALVATLMVIVQLNPVHALLYLIIALMSIATIFYLMGAPFAAALEVIIYAGAIMVLFVFVVMMLNLGPQIQHHDHENEQHHDRPRIDDHLQSGGKRRPHQVENGSDRHQGDDQVEQGMHRVELNDHHECSNQGHAGRHVKDDVHVVVLGSVLRFRV